MNITIYIGITKARTAIIRMDQPFDTEMDLDKEYRYDFPLNEDKKVRILISFIGRYLNENLTDDAFNTSIPQLYMEIEDVETVKMIAIDGSEDDSEYEKYAGDNRIVTMTTLGYKNKDDKENE